MVTQFVFVFLFPNLENGNPAIQICGPKIMFDRGPVVAFSVFDWEEQKMDPVIVQKLSDRSNISLSIGFLQHIWFPDKNEEKALEKRTSEAQANRKRDKFHQEYLLLQLHLVS